MLTVTVIVAGAAENLLPVSPASSLSVDCEGNACAQVTLTFDDAKQQYKVQNNSNQLVRVEASNLAGGEPDSRRSGQGCIPADEEHSRLVPRQLRIR
jgi:hypothetical protein